MKYQEFELELLKTGFTIKDFASLLSMNPNSITAFQSDGVIPLNIAIMLALIANIKSSGGDPELIINAVKRQHSTDLLAQII